MPPAIAKPPLAPQTGATVAKLAPPGGMNPRDRTGASNKPSVVEGERPSQIERRAVELCLEAVRGQMKRREEEGLSATAFFVGVSNVIFITYVFGAFPEHFWLLYALESLYLFPKRYFYRYKLLLRTNDHIFGY